MHWLRNLDDNVLNPANEWMNFIKDSLPGATPPLCSPHCTLQYFENESEAQPQQWLSRQPGKIQVQDCSIILGKQGAAWKIACILKKSLKLEIVFLMLHC